MLMNFSPELPQNIFRSSMWKSLQRRTKAGEIYSNTKNIQKRIEERIGKKLHLNITISGENESRN